MATTDRDSFSELVTSGNVTTADVITRIPVIGQLFLIALYSATTLLAVVGNGLAIIVFATGSRSRTSSLRHFLISLAVADLVMALFCMPFTFTMTILLDWVFSPLLCPVVLFLQTLSVTASVATNVAIGIDRYCAVVRPLRAHTSAPRRRLVIVIVWLVSALLSSVQLFVAREQSFPDSDRKNCLELWPQPEVVFRRGYTCFLLLTNYFVPVVVLSVTYGSVCRHLRRRSRPGNRDAIRDEQQNKSTRKVSVLLCVLHR